MTRGEIKCGYQKKHGHAMAEQDCTAFLKLLDLMNITAVSYEDGQQKICDKMLQMFYVVEAGGDPKGEIN